MALPLDSLLTSATPDDGFSPEFGTVTVPTERPIDMLKPESDLHRDVLSYLKKRIDASYDKMQQFHLRWTANEKKAQAYISLPVWEEELKRANDAGEVPMITRLVVPFSYAAMSTVTTFMLHVFTGRRPIFQVGATQAESVQPAQNMEVKLQYDADHTRLIRSLKQGYDDFQLYGFEAKRVMWQRSEKMRTVRKQQPQYDMLTGQVIGYADEISREPRVVYEGNVVASIDPFFFLPDPRVPMAEVNRRGEFVFWESLEGEHALLRDQADGMFQWVEQIPKKRPIRVNELLSSRNIKAVGGDGIAGAMYGSALSLDENVLVTQGSIEIIPRRLGLGESEKPEKWMFAIGNEGQIIQAEPMDDDHGLHPVAVSEPYGFGYSFGHPGALDYMGPIQDALSWLINTRIENVRTAINNMWLVDPSKVEIQDLKKPGAGKVIRLKPMAVGTDVRTAVQQLLVNDVTTAHVKDAELMMMLGQLLLGINENIMGLPQAGGRKTATEVRTSGEGAVSRLTALAKIHSTQGGTDLTEMMSLNNQQYLSSSFYATVTGADGLRDPIFIGPEMLVGDFYYPIHDGTLPLDRVAMLDVWKEILFGVAQDPELRQQYSLPKVFEYVAELGGARNIQSMKRAPGMEMQLMQDPSAMVQQGNAVPMPQQMRQSPLVMARQGGAGNRLAGALL